MKKLLITLFSFFILFMNGREANVVMSQYSFEENNSNPFLLDKDKPWWKLALIDAGAAVGAGATVLGTTGGVAATNPVGWAATIAGGVIGGAGGTLAATISTNSGNDMPEWMRRAFVNSTIPEVANSFGGNPYDSVGQNHNKLVADYFKTKKLYTPESFLEFIKKNPYKYGLTEINIISLENLKKIDSENLKERSEEQIVEYIMKYMPASIHSELKNLLFNAQHSACLQDDLFNIIKFESKIAQNSKLSENDKGLLYIFLSTYRNSIQLWYNVYKFNETPIIKKDSNVMETKVRKLN